MAIGILAVALSLSLGFPVARAATCSLDTLTDNCKVFDPTQRFIDGPDGEKIPNFSYRPQGFATPVADIKKPAEYWENMFALQRQLTGKVSAEAAFYLGNNPEVISTISQALEGGMDDGELRSPIEVYWPLNSRAGKVQQRPLRDVVGYFRKSFTRRQLDDLVKTASQAEMMQIQMQAPPPPPLQRKAGDQLGSIDVKELVSEARKSIEATILRGRTEEQLSEREKQALVRLRTVEFSGVEKCPGTAPNAFYNSHRHSLGVCEQFAGWPTVSLMYVIGHELGHAIDPCICNHSLDKLDYPKLIKSASSGQSGPEIKKAARSILSNAGGQIYQSGQMAWRAGEEIQKGRKLLIEAGAINEVVPESNIQSYPFLSLSQCLASSEGGDFRSSEAQIQPALQRILQSRRYTPEQAARLQKSVNDHPECFPSAGNHSQMGEAVADWFGVRVVADAMKKKSREWNGTQRLAPIMLLANLACAERNNPGDRAAAGLLADSLSDLGAAHPMPQERMEQIFFRDPEVAKLLKCEPTGKACGLEGGGTRARPQKGVQ